MSGQSEGIARSTHLMKKRRENSPVTSPCCIISAKVPSSGYAVTVYGMKTVLRKFIEKYLHVTSALDTSRRGPDVKEIISDRAYHVAPGFSLLALMRRGAFLWWQRARRTSRTKPRRASRLRLHSDSADKSPLMAAAVALEVPRVRERSRTSSRDRSVCTRFALLANVEYA